MPKSSNSRGLTRGIKNLIGFRQDVPQGATQADIVKLANDQGFEVVQGEDGLVAVPKNSLSGGGIADFQQAYSALWAQAGAAAPRELRFRSYEEMDASGGLGAVVLNTYADEVVNVSAVSEKSLKIEIEGVDQELIAKIKECLRMNDVTGSVREDIYALCKYGDFAYLLEPIVSNGFVQLDKDTINEATVIDRPLEPHQICIIPVTSPRYELKGVRGRVFELEVQDDAREYVAKTHQTNYQPWQFSLMSIRSRDTFPYGLSVLEKSRVPWEQLQTTEQLLAITRANKVDRINVAIPMKTADPMSALVKLNQLKTSLKNMFFSGGSGPAQSFRASDGAMTRPRDVAFTEYLFTPEDFKVNRLSTSTDIGSIEDVEYFRDNFITSTGMPKGYFLADKTDTRPGTLRQQDVSFARKLIPVAEAYCRGLTNLIRLIGFYVGADLSKLIVTVSLKGSTFISEDVLKMIQQTVSVMQEWINLRKQIYGEEWAPTKDDIKGLLSYVDVPNELAFTTEDAEVPEDITDVNKLGKFLVESLKGVSVKSAPVTSLQEVVTL